MQSNFVWSEIWIGLRRNLTMTVALIVVVAISLSLLGTGFLFVKQVEATQTFWNSQAGVEVFLCTANDPYPQCHGVPTKAEDAALIARAEQIPQVLPVSQGGVTTTSPLQALQMFKSSPNEKAIAATLTQDDLPASINIRTKNATADDSIVVSAFTGASGVEQVIDEVSLLAKFYALLNSLRNAVVIVALILVIAAILLVANTIRLSAFNRRRETGIMRLVGASDFYIQLPFLLEGVIAGLIGWAVAAVMLIGVKVLVLDSLQQYTGSIGLSSSDLVQVIVLAMFVGILLTGTTSFVTLRRYLKV